VAGLVLAGWLGLGWLAGWLAVLGVAGLGLAWWLAGLGVAGWAWVGLGWFGLGWLVGSLTIGYTTVQILQSKSEFFLTPATVQPNQCNIATVVYRRITDQHYY
jgi:hypothetical protein